MANRESRNIRHFDVVMGMFFRFLNRDHFGFLPRADAETYKERNKYDQDREHDNTNRYQCISHNLYTGIFGRMQILIPVSFCLERRRPYGRGLG